MKISELIKKLQEIQKEHGDIESYYLYRDDYCNTDYMRFFVINQRLFIEQLWNTEKTNEQRT